MPTSPPFRRPSPAARAFAARRARSRGPPRPDLIFRSADPRIPRLSPHSSPSLRKGTSPRRSSPSRPPRTCSAAGPSPSPFAPASTLVRDPPIRAISRSIDGIVLDRFRSPRAFATLRSPPSVAAATRAIGVIYGIFQNRFLRLPRQQSAHRNVPGFPQQRSTRRTPPAPTCSTPAPTPVSPTCPISTSTCVPTLSFTPEPYTRLRARFARIAGNSPRVSKTRVFFTSDGSPRAFFSLKAKNFERKTRFVFSVGRLADLFPSVNASALPPPRTKPTRADLHRSPRAASTSPASPATSRSTCRTSARNRARTG